MNAAAYYGIEPGQVYLRADGTPGRLVVRDIALHAKVGDVVVFDTLLQEEQRIGAYKLARVRYYLFDFSAGDSRQELLAALRRGDASEHQQQRLARLFEAQGDALQEQQSHARRGAFAVANGEWRRKEDPRDGERTWLCLRLEDGADLSCKGTRGAALDKAIERERALWPYS